MCNQITVLAQVDAQRRMSCCEHGVAHLIWGNVLLRLPLARLGALGQSLAECAQVARTLRIAAHEDVCVVYDPYGQVQVWILGVGLCLSPADFNTLCGMVKRACEHPGTPRPYAECPPGVCPFPASGPIRTGYHLFSQN